MADSLLGGIVINEILVDPNGTLNFDTDGNGVADAIDEYVELYNASGTAIDISGLELWDAGVGHWFTFPPGTTLEPGAHAMVMSGLSGGSYPTGEPDDLFFDAGRSSPLINNDGDNVVLYDPDNDEYVIATYNGDAMDDPTQGQNGYAGFSATATQSGSGEDFGNDTDGLSLQRAGDGSDTFTSDGPTPGNTNVCFVDGTRIATPCGEVPVEKLAPNDLVCTADHQAQAVSWVYSALWKPHEMMANWRLAPVRISRGALGGGLPRRNLYLSQQHRVLVQGAIAKRMFGADEVLIAAKFLLDLPGVFLSFPNREIGYYHVMLEQHEVLISEGARTESLYLGPQALKSIPCEAQEELALILGLPAGLMSRTPPAPARPFAQGKRARQLISRHLKNSKPLTLAA
ncbi:MAG: hypothetical protein CSA68_11915 [Rhodobacterales bacterium]|nr:MAG: hypothetical protein CSA68_11915 [Rhodobacterales bacterium]